MKLEHFGMAEPGDCRLVFTATAPRSWRQPLHSRAEPRRALPQEEDGLLTAAVNRAILERLFGACMRSWWQEYHGW